ncbi:uncharacterized protein LOC132750605 isoform X2 [Ruditapes philippinarum]|uniref:uncharacterized protein LOC132750605 isoform X2 n=1 Tax=Ruditapes philippinarum TaxID=129788 RepID=UPI00295B6DAB|nr:uncharacterized protein LOC132750605 isoform X2 [Ruditapes philippinarum]
MSDYRSKLDDTKFHNWIKTGLALLYTKEGLRDIVLEEIEKFKQRTFQDILARLNLPKDSSCIECSTGQLVRKECSESHECPQSGLCEKFRDEIRLAHKHNKPSWRNTDARKWCNDSWQIAKCFMPREGYKDKNSFMETDFNGIISVILNYKPFQDKVKEDLTQKSNAFEEARRMSREFRHSATCEVSDDEFTEYSRILETILTDPKYLSSKASTKAALQNIAKLKEESWTITFIVKDLRSLFNAELGLYANNTSVCRALEHLYNKLDDVKRAIEQLKMPLCHLASLQDFAKRLIEVYQDQFSTLPISALLEEEDAQLLEFFVQPTLKQVDHHNVKSKSAIIKSYKDIFSKGGQPCRNIYITGEAGIGKTAFCQRMVLTWCHAKSGKTENHNFLKEDIDALKQFSFLFYVSLRETRLCHVKEMIEQQLQVLADTHHIGQILENQVCLIILDGLDEWTHPTIQDTCPNNQKLPHRLPSRNCIFITTTRPWKLEVNRLKTKEIDQQIVLTGLDKQARAKLTVTVINRLNKNYDEPRKPEDFKEEVALNKLDTICEVPIILMQLICVWFDELTLGKSKCLIYGGTVDMLFKRASKNKGGQCADGACLNQTQTQDDFNRNLPECFISLQNILIHKSLLYKIGNLAFHSLFGIPDGESALTFESSSGNIYDISVGEMRYLLSVGILSKNKVVGTLYQRQQRLSFLHKSYHEFFAALYIAMQEDVACVENKIFTTCKTLRMFLTYENMFIFLSGMCPELVLKLEAKIKLMLLSDKQIRTYRSFADYKFGFVVMLPPFSIITNPKFSDVRDAERLLQSYQTLALQCQEESQQTVGRGVQLPLEDFFLPETYSDNLRSLFESNKGILKSIATEKYHDDLLEIRNVEKISINFHNNFDNDMEKYLGCLNSSIETLACLSISNARGMFNLVELQFPNLTSLDLYDISLKHQELMDLFEFISDKSDLIQLLLFQIRCYEHKEECMGSSLNLSSHNQLNFLRLHHLFEYGQHETRVNCTSLDTLIFEDSSTATHKTSTLLLDIKCAPHLFELTLIGISSVDTFKTLLSVLPSIKHLRRLSLYNCDFGDRHVEFDAEFQKEIELICLLNSTMTLNSFVKFVDSIPLNTDSVISVHMQSCMFNIGDNERLAQEGVEAASRYVRSKPNFHVVVCEPFKFHFKVSSRPHY